MASLQLRGRSYAYVFCWHGQRKWFTIGKVSETEARAKSSQVDYLLMRLKQRLIELPPGADIVEFVRHDGKPPLSLGAIPERQALTLTALRDRYLKTHRPSLERRTGLKPCGPGVRCRRESSPSTWTCFVLWRVKSPLWPKVLIPRGLRQS